MLLLSANLKLTEKEYNGIDAMPQDVRQLYEKMLKAAESGAVPADMITARNVNIMPTIAKTSRTASVGIKGTPTKFEPAFSARKLIVGLMLIALIIFLYFIFLSK
ncbi:MAG: hypothetical protein NTW95_02090 [Candidatus Aminicenantes bacterium]|nr:hypothetical protein [Candidatus Aminicenantes bacterium]